jgi:hypothetical protein
MPYRLWLHYFNTFLTLASDGNESADSPPGRYYPRGLQTRFGRHGKHTKKLLLLSGTETQILSS